MSIPLRQSMRIGIVQFMAYPSTMSGKGPILESIAELAADEFFDVIEVTHIEDPEIRREAARMARIAGLDIAFGSQPLVLGQKLSLHSRNAGERQKALQIILAALEEAVEIGAVGFATMSGVDPGPSHRSEETKLFIDSLHQICARAQKLNSNLNVVVETFDRAPYAKNCMVGPTDEAVKIAEVLRKDYPRFGLMLDLSHLPLLNESSDHAITAAGSVLLHAHIGNCVKKNSQNPYYGDNHPPFDYEDGENAEDELVNYLRCLRDVGYLNPKHPPIVTIEVKPLSDAMRPACMGNVKRTLNRAISRLKRM